LAVGVGVGLLVVPAAVPLDLAAGARPTSAAVSGQVFDDERTVKATFEVSGRIPLVTGARGVVTGTALTGPGRLASGQVALWVDGLAVVALHTGTPFYRDLAVGARGPDVAGLNAELERLGLLAAGAGDLFSQATRAAWQELQTRAGSGERKAELTLDRVVWLPAVETTVALWSVVLGGPVPADGLLGQVDGVLTQIGLSLAAEGELVEGERVLRLYGLEIQVAGLEPVTDPAFLAAVAGTDEFHNLMLQPEVRQASGQVRLVEGIAAWRVPPTALFGIEGRLGCVEAGGRAVPVRVLGSSMGASLVQAEEPLTEVAVGVGVSLTDCPRP
jgi:hypothetical protein